MSRGWGTISWFNVWWLFVNVASTIKKFPHDHSLLIYHTSCFTILLATASLPPSLWYHLLPPSFTLFPLLPLATFLNHCLIPQSPIVISLHYLLYRLVPFSKTTISCTAIAISPSSPLSSHTVISCNTILHCHLLCCLLPDSLSTISHWHFLLLSLMLSTPAVSWCQLV